MLITASLAPPNLARKFCKPNGLESISRKQKKKVQLFISPVKIKTGKNLGYFNNNKTSML